MTLRRDVCLLLALAAPVRCPRFAPPPVATFFAC